MTGPIELGAARHRAARRRAAGVAVDFDPSRLSLARRLAGLQRTRLARSVDVTPAAITQYEKGQAKPTLPVLDGLATALNVSVEFFRAGGSLVPALPADGAHFRSLRSTTVSEREQALAFAELTLAVFAGVEQYVEMPPPQVPALDVTPELDLAEVARLAQQTRHDMNVASGPVPHMVRLLEAHGVAVVQLDSDVRRVDAFSHQDGRRPLVLLNPDKQDKARSRFDAAHELGHLVMHHDTHAGSRLVEQQAHAFAAEFLAPAAELGRDLPTKLDWVALHNLKRRWGISLKALLVRAHTLGRISDTTYQRGMRQLSSWGHPERGSLGPPETPVLLPRAVDLLGGQQFLDHFADEIGIPSMEVQRIWLAAGGQQAPPRIALTTIT